MNIVHTSINIVIFLVKNFCLCILVDGHDSAEDARTCMELMLRRLKEDAKKELRR
jgi:hypothetical protein